MKGIEYAFISLRVTIPEKTALRAAANREKRSLANYLLNSGLERAQINYDILPQYDCESVLEEGAVDGQDQDS